VIVFAYRYLFPPNPDSRHDVYLSEYLQISRQQHLNCNGRGAAQGRLACTWRSPVSPWSSIGITAS
jgi:hypothetical protein